MQWKHTQIQNKQLPLNLKYKVLAVKALLDLHKGLWSYGGYNLMGSDYPQIFSAS